jgi:hypothetical protein
MVIDQICRRIPHKLGGLGGQFGVGHGYTGEGGRFQEHIAFGISHGFSFFRMTHRRIGG